MKKKWKSCLPPRMMVTTIILMAAISRQDDVIMEYTGSASTGNGENLTGTWWADHGYEHAHAFTWRTWPLGGRGQLLDSSPAEAPGHRRKLLTDRPRNSLRTGTFSIVQSSSITQTRFPKVLIPSFFTIHSQLSGTRSVPPVSARTSPLP